MRRRALRRTVASVRLSRSLSQARKPDQSIVDWAVAAMLLALGETDLWSGAQQFTTFHGSRAGATVFVIAVTLPLGFRRRWPLAVQGTVMGTIAVASLLAGKSPQGAVLLFPTLITMYSVGAHSDLPRALLGFAVGFAGSLTETLLDPEVVTVGNIVVVEGFFFVFLGGACWLVGRYVRGRRFDAERSEDRAVRLEREQAERERAAAAAERGRIARELHDVIAHSVSLMGVQAGAVERVLERDPDKAREALRSIQATARESVGELRRLLGILRAQEEPLGVSPQPGLAALSSLVEENRSAGLSVALAVDGDARALPAGVELSAYRVIQEALTNVRKHAPGASAQVRLCYRAHEVELIVLNSASTATNGRPRTSTQSSGHGLVGMRERVAIYGGLLEARPETDGGFIVRARIPVQGP
jgi:signal transduction histidine kinase